MRRSQSAHTPVGVRRQQSSSVDNDDDDDIHSTRALRHQSSSVVKDDKEDDTHSTAERSSDVIKGNINKFSNEVDEDDESTQTDLMDDEFEKHAISCLRYFVLFLMVAFTIAAGVTTWKFLKREEQNQFINEVRQSPHVCNPRFVRCYNSLTNLFNCISLTLLWRTSRS
jgi:hypothetical protein